ncbi:GNAT family N-acetyltransferase [Halobacillus sp. Marseille-P3879]|uniref:GNAT family N-acetyltransferase n=1 Tax=Halobacillus sp. Marseille-P3879 TaxID=2045014 RepID=UPI000C7CEAE9|nr:GNAT family N-acetyltransferase [Halobacillus sp. Marseille-P3879]
MHFETIDIDKHRDQVVEFRKDSFKVSFGKMSNFEKLDYINWLEQKTNDFPGGFVLVEEDKRYIGQLELSIREYEGKMIGYVHLYYLIPEMRGKGKGKELNEYAIKFFKEHHVSDYHLRVSITNTSAINFYHKIGMREVGLEVEGKVMRMKGYI